MCNDMAGEIPSYHTKQSLDSWASAPEGGAGSGRVDAVERHAVGPYRRQVSCVQPNGAPVPDQKQVLQPSNNVMQSAGMLPLDPLLGGAACRAKKRCQGC